MSFKQIGRLAEIGQAQQITKQFAKREFSLEVPGYQGRQDAMFFTLTNNNVSMLDGYAPNAEVVVSFDISCRAVTTKDGRAMRITELRAWRIEPYQATRQAAPPQYQPMQPQQYQPMPQFDTNSQLPF